MKARSSLLLYVVCFWAMRVLADDCNNNGREDGDDLKSGSSSDCNQNGVPDECDDPRNRFAAPQRYGTGTVFSLALADFDGDSDLDVAGVRRGNCCSLDLFWNSGTGDLGESSALVVTQTPNLLSVADVDLDSRPDLIFFFASPHRIESFRSVNERMFTRLATRQLTSFLGTLSVFDLTGDSLPDVIGTTNRAGVVEVVVCANAGDGSFASPKSTSMPGVLAPFFMTAGDLTGDGRGDVAFIYGGAEPTLATLRSSGGELSDLRRYSAGASVGSGAEARIADFTGDGHADIILADDSRNVALFANNGDGSLAASPFRFLGFSTAGLAVGDLDDDGDVDVVVGSRVALLFNDGSGAFGTPVLLHDQSQALLFETGDLDRDGDLDITGSTINSQGGVFVTLNRTILSAGGAADCDADSISDECEILVQPDLDCDLSGRLDACEIADGSVSDCNRNGSPDHCESLQDCDASGTPDECEEPFTDCDANGIKDTCQIAGSPHLDCNGNGALDACEEPFTDCDANGIEDTCQIVGSPHLDCNGNGALDACDIRNATSTDSNRNGRPDECETRFRRGDVNTDGSVDVTDAVLLHLLSGSWGYNHFSFSCHDALDVNDDGFAGDLSDWAATLLYLAAGGDPPAPPGPVVPGLDLTEDPWECETYAPREQPSVADVRFFFEDCPERITGAPGEVITFDVYLAVATSNNTSDPAPGHGTWSPLGPRAWAFSIGAENLRVDSVEPAGAWVDSSHDWVGQPLGPQEEGAIAHAMLKDLEGRQPNSLPADGIDRIGALRLRATIPDGEPLRAVLTFIDDRGTGPPVRNTAVFLHDKDAVSQFPSLGRCEIMLSRAEARQLPADCNQDGGADVSDAICLFGYLFLGLPATLPCSDSSLPGPGDLVLLDANGDSKLDISDGVYLLAWMFLGGSPPGSGTECRAIAGCPEVCGH